MLARPSVSVVMAAHNAEPFIRLAVRSILLQTYRDFELVVRNDGSTDRTGEILDEVARSDERLRVIHGEKYGLAKSLNVAIATCRSPLIARMDADDVALPTRLEEQVAFLERYPQTAAAGTGAWLWNGSNNLGPAIDVIESPDAIRKTLPYSNCLAHPTTMMRRDALCAIGGYRACFPSAEDYDLWLRLSSRGDLRNLAKPLLLYRQHAAQMTQAMKLETALGSVAAQQAHQARLKTGCDPLEGQESLTVDTLKAIGVHDADEKLQELLAVNMPLALGAAEDDQIGGILANVRSRKRSVNQRRAAEGALHRMLALRHLYRGRWSAATAELALAMFFCPGILLSIRRQLQNAFEDLRSPRRAEALAFLAALHAEKGTPEDGSPPMRRDRVGIPGNLAEERSAVPFVDEQQSQTCTGFD